MSLEWLHKMHSMHKSRRGIILVILLIAIYNKSQGQKYYVKGQSKLA